MHYCTCYLRLTCYLDCLHYLILHLLVCPFYGLVGKADPPPVKFIRLLLQLASALFYY